VTRRATPSKPITRPAPTDDELSKLPGVVSSTPVRPAPAPATAVVPPPAETTAPRPVAATVTETASATATQTTITTETLAPESTTTAEEEGAAQIAQPRRPNFIIPLILILIGIGVLIVLFRASS
jgi:hypothetical protein